MADQNTTPSLRRTGRRRQMTSGPLSPAKSLPFYFYHLAFEPPQIPRIYGQLFGFTPSRTPLKLFLHNRLQTHFEQPSVADAHAFPKDRVGGNPTIYAPLIVPDLKPLSLNRFDQVKIFVALYLAQNDVSHFDVFCVDRFHRTKLSGFNFAGHRITARPKRNCFAAFQLRDVMRRPRHSIQNLKTKFFGVFPRSTYTRLRRRYSTARVSKRLTYE